MLIKNKKRLLCIIGSMNTGGAETFLMKLYRELDKEKYQMDFLLSVKEEGFYDKEIKALGGKIYFVKPKSKNPVESFFGIYKTVKNYKYNYVIRINQHSLATLDLLAAKLGGAKILVQRSSNTDSGSDISRLLHILFKFLPSRIPTLKLAPSTEAAEYTFGEGCTDKRNVKLLNNGIELKGFLFDEKKRLSIRDELNLKDKFVVGHVGRFSQQKNHNFLIKIFSEIHKKNSESVLLLVGKGELEIKIIEKIESLGLTDSVIFTGVRQDIPDLLMAMDVFVFPSFFEGMPNTVIEAQATGLQCLVSDTITKEVKITNLVNFISIEESPKVWSELVLKKSEKLIRNNMSDIFIKKGYDILSVTRKFEELVFEK